MLGGRRLISINLWPYRRIGSTFNSMVTDLNAYRKSQSGKKARAFGDLFEDMFQTMCQKTGVAITRFPNGCRSIGGNHVVQIKTPFDWIVTHNGMSAMIDTKTSEELAFGHSKIKNHQIQEMIKHEMAGAKAGYVIWLRKSDSVVYVPATDLERVARTRGSIQFGQNHVRLLGNASYFDIRVIFRKDAPIEPPHAG